MKEIDTFLIETHSTLTARQQAKQLGKPYHLVISRRMRLYRQGRLSASDRAYLPRWTREEDEFLEDHYSIRTIKTLCQRLGRSEIAIIMHKRRLGLHRTDGFYTAASLGDIFGIDQKGVAWFAEQKWLKGSRAPYKQGNNRPRFFSEQNVRKFIRRYPWLLRPEKMTEHFFRSLLLKEWRRDPWYSVKQAAKLLGCADDTLLRYVHSGAVEAFKRQRDRKWGIFWVRRSALEGFWEKVKENKRQKSREARLNSYRRQGLPTILYTAWQVRCPDCGEIFSVEAPPRVHGPQVLELARQQHKCLIQQ